MPAVTKSHASSPAPLTTRPNVTPAAQSTSLATDPLPTSRVNKCNFPEIKTAIDDIVKDVSGAARRVQRDYTTNTSTSWSRRSPSRVCIQQCTWPLAMRLC